MLAFSSCAVALIVVVLVVWSNRTAVAQTQPAGLSPDPIRKHAAIHVRRDMLSGEPLLPVGPTEDRVRGVEISVRGVVRQINDDWIVLERDRNFAYVPRKNVLVMEVDK
jgi:hypothetical protein